MIEYIGDEIIFSLDKKEDRKSWVREIKRVKEQLGNIGV
jgi:hypothetical protein